jgi:hypothetical protein
MLLSFCMGYGVTVGFGLLSDLAIENVLFWPMAGMEIVFI